MKKELPGSKSFKKPFFYFEPLKMWEQIVIALYGVFTVVFFSWYLLSNIDSKKAILILYGISLQLGLYFGLYTSLRNLKSYLIWCCFGVLHLTIYFLTINDDSLQMIRGHASSSLVNTIVMLLIFQFLRFISLKLQHREFVVPAHGGGKDLFENKSLSKADFLIFLIYLSSWAGLFFLSVN